MFDSLDPFSVAVGAIAGAFIAAIIIDFHNEGVEGREDECAQREIDRLKNGGR